MIRSGRTPAPNFCRGTGKQVSKKEQYEEKAWEILLPVLDELGMTPVDVEFVKEGGEYYLRCYIDKEGGVGINDCETVSRRIDPMLDEADFIDESYTLEVSSPGLGRALKRPRDFEYARGKEVELRTYRPVGGKKEMRGILTGWDDRTVTISKDGEEEQIFERGDISLLRLAFDFE